MIVVLSLYRPRVEDYLAARGQKILALVPHSVRSHRQASNPGYPIRSIGRWDDYNELISLAREFEALGVTAVATIDEPCIPAAGFLRDLLGLPGQNHRSAIACTDKSVMKQHLAAAGIPVAEHRVTHGVEQIRDFLDQLGSDIVVKPRYGFGAINTHRVSQANFDELVAAGAFQAPRDLPEYFESTTMTADVGRASYLAERYIDVVAEYHCEILLHEGAQVHCVAGRYSSPILADFTAGSVWLDPDSTEASTVCELTREAASALGFTHGFGHCEVFLDRSGRWFLGEFASRPGGMMIPRMLSLSYGIDNMALLADQLAGRRPVSTQVPLMSGNIAWCAVPVEPGVITEMPEDEDLLQLPGVIEADIVLRPGDSTAGLPASMFNAAYLFCVGESPEHAETLVQHAQRACRITVDQAA
jgi:biotin carboxylase